MSEPSRPISTDLVTPTPGPWKAEVSDILGIIVYSERCHSMIAPCNTLGTEGAAFVESVEQQAANARLIAAAPDLLAAGKRLRAVINDHVSLADVDALDAAIAKAEGREHV